MKKFNARRGFTLIELMIVVAIIGILAAIAIPNFIRYQLKSKQSESKTVLGGIKTSEEAFRAEYDNYCEASQRPTTAAVTTKQQWGVDVPCNTGCDRRNIANCDEWECMGYRPSGDVYFVYDINAPQATFPPNYTAAGQSDLDGDTVNGVFAYGTDNANANAGQAVNDPVFGACNANTGLITEEIVNCEPGAF